MASKSGISGDAKDRDNRAEVKSFDKHSLKHVQTNEKTVLPTAQDIRAELMPEVLPDRSEVTTFDHAKLKHVQTTEKAILPTQEVIDEEKFDFRTGVKSFIKSTLKHVETAFKTYFPGSNEWQATQYLQTMASKSALQVERKNDSKAFFRVISPLIANTGDDILEPVMMHMINDEMKMDKAQKPPFLPAERILTPVSSEAEVTEAILKAKREKKILRVAGSEHSVRDAIFPKDGITLLLTKDLRKVEILHVKVEGGENWLYCRIGAGCYLGKDPLDPHSDLQNSACYQVAVQGFGFPELGGIIQQSIGGFIMTGSAGGSLKHGFADVIQEIEFVNGNGHLQIAKPGTDLWSAVGVSMGLFGVITHVTFHLPEMKLIEGSESDHPFAESLLGPDKVGHSKLKESLEKNEYMRVNWFPQKEVWRVQEWVGKQTSIGDIVPYNSILSCTFTAGMAAIALKMCNSLLLKPRPTEWDYAIIGTILRQFVPLGESKSFRDIWFKTLPMDNEAHTDSIIKVDFTEIWMPLDQCQTVMDKLLKLFENQKAANNFATEIYGAKESPFWLSMSYNQKMVRVDPYWWAYNKGDKREFFSYFWDVLLSGILRHVL